MAYTTIDNPGSFFKTVLYTGDGSTSNAITGVGFQPDWVWIKRRNNANPHFLNDSVRGATKDLRSDGTDAETTNNQYGILKSFDSDGFTVSVGSTNGARANTSGGTFASWNWKAGTSFSNDASATGVGTIDSTGSINTTSGFSIISYTGTGSNGTIAHGLGAVPVMIIFKALGTLNWLVYHKDVANTHALFLNTTSAKDASSTYFQDTTPTSSVFSLGTSNLVNDTNPYIAYCFAEKKGYSKFGSYTGTGVDAGPFSYCGFKPSFVLTKRTDSSGSWVIQDNKRPGYNETSLDLNPNNSEAEESNNGIDMLSNGFKQRNTDAHTNASGGTYIYWAFAENPFVTAGTKAAGTAR